MLDAIETTLDEMEHGKIGRRQAVARLAALLLAFGGTGGIGRAQDRSTSTFESTGLNHLALRVTDVPRSRDFYRQHLGLTVLRDEGESRCFMGCGDNFVALFRGGEPAMDHHCYTVRGYDADAAVKKLDDAGLRPRRHEDRVYFDDPDGLTVQLSGKWDARPAPRPQRS